MKSGTEWRSDERHEPQSNKATTGRRDDGTRRANNGGMAEWQNGGMADGGRLMVEFWGINLERFSDTHVHNHIYLS